MRFFFLLNTLYFFYIAFSVIIVHSVLGDIFAPAKSSFANLYLPILLISGGVGFYTKSLFLSKNDNKPSLLFKLIFLLFYFGCFLVSINYQLFGSFFSASELTSLSIAIAVTGTFIEGWFILFPKSRNTEH